jgi:hypothetical protein
MSKEEARRQAYLKFGSPERIREKFGRGTASRRLKMHFAIFDMHGGRYIGVQDTRLWRF